MAGIPLVLAVPDEERAGALIDGTVRLEGFDLTVLHDWKTVHQRHRGVMFGEFDAGEICVSACIHTRFPGQGEPQLALPIFFMRGFRHRNILVRKDSGLTGFAQLAGKKIGLTRDSATTIVWIKGWLEEEYGVRMGDVKWVAADPQYFAGKRTVSVPLIDSGRPGLLQMLSDGEIDAAIFPGNNDYSSIYGGGSLDKLIAPYGNLKSMIEDPEVILDYYRRGGVLPVIHFVSVKESLVKRYPHLVPELLRAFRQARKLAPNYGDAGRKREMEEECLVLDRDPYDYRLGEQEAKVLETLMRYLVEQGYIKKPLALESLFAPGSLD